MGKRGATGQGASKRAARASRPTRSPKGAKGKRGAAQGASKRAARASRTTGSPKGRVDSASAAGVDRRLAAIERSVDELASAVEAVRAAVGRKGELGISVRRTHMGMDAVLRRLFLGDDDLPYPYRLTANRFGILSQNDEDGITLAIFREAGVTSSRFVEIACGENGGNSGFLARELGWSGLMVDQDPECVAVARARFNAERVKVVQAWITRENVNELLQEHEATGEIDLLSIDIDGNDYWVWEAIDVCSPRVVIIECNVQFGPERAVAVPYDPDFDRHAINPFYCGASLMAMVQLGRRKGYRLVTTEPSGPNAYFLRDDVAPSIPAADPREVFHPRQTELDRQRGPKQRARGTAPEGEDLYAYIDEHSLPLVEFTAD